MNLRDNIGDFVDANPELHGELFAVFDHGLVCRVLNGMWKVTDAEVRRLLDRKKYITKTRVRPPHEPVRCNGKIIYETRQLAMVKANIILKRGRDALRVYKCPHCPGFHLTHKILLTT